jgi:hypothetical protein
MEQSSMHKHGLDGVVGGRRRLFGELVQPVRNLARGRRRGIERQLQHRRRRRARGGAQIRRGEADAQSSEQRQGVVQQSIAALGFFNQLFLTADRCGDLIDRGCRLAIDGGGLTQSIERTVQGVDFPDQRIVVAQRADARAVDIAVQRVFHHGEAIELADGLIEHF